MESIHSSTDWHHLVSNIVRKASVVNRNLYTQNYKRTVVDCDGLNAFFT